MGGYLSSPTETSTTEEQRARAGKEKESQEEKKNTEGSDCGIHMNPHGTFNGCHFTINNGSEDITNQENGSRGETVNHRKRRWRQRRLMQNSTGSPNRQRTRLDVPVNPDLDYDSFRNVNDSSRNEIQIEEIIQNTTSNRPLDVDLESMRMDSSLILETNHFDGIEQARGLESRASIVRNPTGDGLGLEMDELTNVTNSDCTFYQDEMAHDYDCWTIIGVESHAPMNPG